MADHGSSQPSFPDRARESVDLVLFACRVVAFPIELYVTRFGTWGPRYLDFSAVLGFLWPMVFFGLSGPQPEPEAVAILMFWWGSVILLLAHRVKGIVLRSRGYVCHSRYRGDSRFAPLGEENSPKSDALEFLTTLSVSLAVLAVVKVLGTVLLIGSVALLVTRRMAQDMIEARLREMEDLQIENEFYGERFRQRRDRR